MTTLNPQLNEKLTHKELRLLILLAGDNTLEEVAKIAKISISTANQQIASVRKKLGVKTTYGALIKWFG
jgi:DNA-binding CsgD family transcriptional regulator